MTLVQGDQSPTKKWSSPRGSIPHSPAGFNEYTCWNLCWDRPTNGPTNPDTDFKMVRGRTIKRKEKKRRHFSIFNFWLLRLLIFSQIACKWLRALQFIFIYDCGMRSLLQLLGPFHPLIARPFPLHTGKHTDTEEVTSMQAMLVDNFEKFSDQIVPYSPR